MEKLEIKGTDSTPHVYFDSSKGLFEIKGISHPENPLKFFAPVIEWIDGYAKKPNNETVLNIDLEYFNSSTAKYLLNIIWAFEKIKKLHTMVSVSVNWHYKEEDIDAHAAGERYAQLTTIPISLIKS